MPVNRGDPLSIAAGDWNDIVRLLEQWRANGRQLGSLGISQPLPFGWVWIKNTSASDRAFGDVLGVDDWLFDLGSISARRYEGVKLKGSTPSTTTHCGNYAVLQEPIAAGKIGRAIVNGETAVKLNITHASDKYCEIANNTATALTTNPLGSSRIIVKSTGTGSSNKWGYIKLGEPSGEILGKTDTSVTGGGTATVSVYAGTAGSESDTGQDVVSCYLRSGYVPASTFVKIAVSNGNPYILGDHRQVIGKADSTITKGSTGTFSIYNNETDTTDNITAKALGAQVTGAKWATAWQEEKSGTWYCGCWES